MYSRIWKHLRFLWSNICIICQFISWLTAYCPKKGNFNRKYAAEVIIKLKESCIHSIEKLKILLQEQYNSRPVNHWILLRKKVSGERYTEKGFLLKLIICRWRWRRLQTTSKWSSCFTRRWGPFTRKHLLERGGTAFLCLGGISCCSNCSDIFSNLLSHVLDPELIAGKMKIWIIF